MRIKRLLKSILPVSWLIFIYRIRGMVSYLPYLVYDTKTLFKNSETDAALANISKQSHRLEKGLGHKNMRLNFGRRALIELERSLKIVSNVESLKSSTRVKVALKVLDEYERLHPHGCKNADIIYKIKRLALVSGEVGAGVKKYKDKDRAPLNGYEEVVKFRHSTRYFAAVKPCLLKINKALEIARNTPSVCNRQGWFVYIVQDESLLKFFQQQHNGFSDPDQNLTTLAIICYNKNYFESPKERHQGYFDAGLFTMNFTNSVTSCGLASCILNANLSTSVLNKLHRMFQLSESHIITNFIAIGEYADEYNYPVSVKESVEQQVKYVSACNE